MFWFHKSSIRHTIQIYFSRPMVCCCCCFSWELPVQVLHRPVKFAGQEWSENKNAMLPQIKTDCTSWKWAHTIQIWICLLKIGRSHGKKPGSIETMSSHIKLRGHCETVKSKNPRPKMSSRNTHRHRAGRPKFVITSAGSKLGHCTAWWWWFYQVVPILNGLVVLGKS